MKWANSDIMREIFQTQPIAKELVKAHLADIDMALQMEMMAAMGPQPPAEASGPARGMANSNQNSGGAGKQSSGSGGTAEPNS
jgi:hypothetical protein